jgi:hypothetical protein
MLREGGREGGRERDMLWSDIPNLEHSLSAHIETRSRGLMSNVVKCVMSNENLFLFETKLHPHQAVPACRLDGYDDGPVRPPPPPLPHRRLQGAAR